MQPKAITHPTDAKLYYKAIIGLGELAKHHHVELRQIYVRVAKLALVKVGRYARARPMKHAKKSQKKLAVYLGRLMRNIHRATAGNDKLRERFLIKLDRSIRILSQSERTPTRFILGMHRK